MRLAMALVPRKPLKRKAFWIIATYANSFISFLLTPMFLRRHLSYRNSAVVSFEYVGKAVRSGIRISHANVVLDDDGKMIEILIM